MNDVLLTLALVGIPFLSNSAANGGPAPARDVQIEQATREFRVQVYHTFHADRDQCERRWAAGREAHAAWLASKRPERHREALVEWFRAATLASQGESTGPLPPLPRFGAVAKTPAKPAPESPTETPVASRPEAEPLVLQTPGTPKLARLEAPPIGVDRPLSRTSGKTRPEFGTRPADLADAAKPETEAVRKTGGTIIAALGHAMLAAASIEQKETVPADSPATDDVPEAWPAELASQMPPEEESPEPDNRILPALDINVADLSARVKGINFRLRSIENDLKDNSRWNARRLTPLVNDLNDLIQRRAVARPYLKLLTAPQRRGVGRLEPIEPAVSALGKRIFQARTRATSDEFEGTRAQRRAELGALDKLSRKLGTVIEKDR